MAAQHAGGDYATRYKFNGKELDPETGYYYYGARYYDPVVSRWLSVDPLAEKYPGLSPYNYTANNPVMLVDPDGRDWIKNNKTGKYVWKNDVTSQKNTPEGWSYIGKEDNAIVIDLFGDNFFRVSDFDIGIVELYYDENGSVIMHMKAETELFVALRANVTTSYNSDGSIASKSFNGIEVNVLVSGETIVGYPSKKSTLLGKAYLNGSEMSFHQNSASEIIPKRGNVAPLRFDGFISTKEIQKHFRNHTYINISFSGQYFYGDKPLLSPTSVLPYINSTNLDMRILMHNYPYYMDFFNRYSNN